MYHYIVNPSSGGRQYDGIQHKLKARLQQLQVDGEFSKTLEQGDAEKITRSFIKRGAKTIVVIGGDNTINDVITTINASGKHSVAVGVIPMGDSIIGRHLGIRDWQHACELLAARRLQPFSVMHINDYSFIHSCSISLSEDTDLPFLAEVDGEFRLRGSAGQIELSNQKLLNSYLPNQLLIRFYSQEPVSWMSRFLKSYKQNSQISQLHARVIILEFEGYYTAVIDGRSFKDNMFRIRLSNAPVKLITDRPQRQGFDSD